MNRKHYLIPLCIFSVITFVEIVNAWTLIGAYDKYMGSDQTDMRAMNAWQGKPGAIQGLFVKFDRSVLYWLKNNLDAIWNTGSVPLLTWEPWFDQEWSPTDISRRVANGQYDQYITDFANVLKAYVAGGDGRLNTNDDRRLYIRYAHEFNGNWYPWSAATYGQTTPQDYVNMWIRVKGLVDGIGLTNVSNVQWVWAGINFDVGGYPIEAYYPGNSTVSTGEQANPTWVGGIPSLLMPECSLEFVPFVETTDLLGSPSILPLILVLGLAERTLGSTNSLTLLKPTTLRWPSISTWIRTKEVVA
jgi:hypothetical protein